MTSAHSFRPPKPMRALQARRTIARAQLSDTRVSKDAVGGHAARQPGDAARSASTRFEHRVSICAG